MKPTQFALATLLIGALASSACQPAAPPSGGGVPAPTRPSATSESSLVGGGATFELSDVSEGLDSLSSYRATFTMSFDGKDADGQPQQGAWSFIEEFSKNPPAKRTRFTGSETGDIGAEAGFELIEVDGRTYSVFGDVCASTDSENAPTADTTFSPSAVIGDIKSSQLAGVENVNGVPAKRYIVDLSETLALGTYTQAKAETWVADPGGFVVKYTFEATGAGALFFGAGDSEGTLRWDYEVADINRPVDIAAPENCSGAPSDIPLMPDAVDTSSFGDLTLYSSPSALADVVAFYQEQMPANGWTEEPAAGEAATDTFTTLNFTKDERTVSITITRDASADTTSVLISLSGEEY